MISLQEVALAQNEVDKRRAEKSIRGAAEEFVHSLADWPEAVLSDAQTEELIESIEIVPDQIHVRGDRARAIVSIGGMPFEFINVEELEKQQPLNSQQISVPRQFISEVYLVKPCERCMKYYVRISHVRTLSDVGEYLSGAPSRKKKRNFCESCLAEEREKQKVSAERTIKEYGDEDMPVKEAEEAPTFFTGTIRAGVSGL